MYRVLNREELFFNAGAFSEKDVRQSIPFAVRSAASCLMKGLSEELS